MDEDAKYEEDGEREGIGSKVKFATCDLSLQ